jgi:diadenosine tetraphosphatase ApaH/serine/threonine PP2A family protein phosphatase
MRALVLSDVHGNLHALEAVLAAEGDRYDELWCLGDIVGYGARPNECIDRLRDAATVVLAGNHDLAVVGKVNVERFGGDAGRAARWTREVLGPEQEAWLDTLEPTATIGRVSLAHASPRDPIWEYVIDGPGAAIALSYVPDAKVVLVGHTHVPMSARSLGDRVTGGHAPPGREEILPEDVRLLANPGSVGQPRDGDSRASYLVLDVDDGEPVRVEFRRTEYDAAATAREIVDAGLPPQFGDRLLFGM